MKHVAAICIKFIIITFVLLMILSAIYNYPFLSTITLSAFVVGISYLVGDIGILRFSNNTVATIADLGLIAIIVWLLGPLIYGADVTFIAAILSAVFIGMGEWVFHIYLAHEVLQRKKDPSPQS
ncbi:YndM family protein [Bacillus shivajii]|uniref:DUF2512 family protein n=1 Tax=Bacillus shivajii TaxID=1983719 RepID=UPI001CFC297B|nr:DUF2512 family protein [Bacillus shivajii]UCZ53228.1 YndM family protein [Bacillus shivajii]